MKTLIAAVVIICAASTAQASNWVGPIPGQTACYYDSQSIRRVNENWMTVWMRCVGNPPVTHLVEFGCPGRMVRFLDSVDGDTGQSHGQTSWQSIVPDSNGDFLHSIVCRNWPR